MRRRDNPIRLLVAFIYLFTFGCTEKNVSDKEARSCKNLERFHIESAKSDAIHAAKNGNKALLAIMGYTDFVPGLDENQIAGRPVVPIEGTTDAYVNTRCKRLNEAAERYATIYNQTIVNIDK